MPIYFIIVVAYVVVLIAMNRRAAQRRAHLPGASRAEAAPRQQQGATPL